MSTALGIFFGVMAVACIVAGRRERRYGFVITPAVLYGMACLFLISLAIVSLVIGGVIE